MATSIGGPPSIFYAREGLAVGRGKSGRLSGGQSVLCDAATAARQLVVNAETDPARLPSDRGNGLFELPATMLARSDNALVFRCVPGPGVGGCLGAGEMESGSIKPTGAFTPLHTVAVEIRPLQTWISVKRARINATDEEDVTTTPLAASVVPDWAADTLEPGSEASGATRVNVLVHGFNVSEAASATETFPQLFRRLYGAGHPVHARQRVLPLGEF